MKKAGLTPEAVEQQLRKLRGNLAALGRHFGCTRNAVWKFVNRREALRQVAEDEREGLKDDAESALYRAVLKGEPWALKFFLSTQAKDRGYTTRTEVASERDAPPIGIKFIEVVRPAPPDGAAERNGDEG
jgi:hypothetical protein